MKKGNNPDDSHTIDNLCKKDKNKMIELLKQLNELKKRCAFLESSINSQNNENQRIEMKNEFISKQIEEVEQKFNESSDLSKEFPKQLEELTLAIQATEIENSNLKVKIKDSTSEASELNNELQRLSAKYNPIYKDASVSCTFSKRREKCINTDDVTANYVEKEFQIPERKKETDFLYEDLTSNTIEPVGTLYDAPDEEITNLISILNSI
ncbi:hypothetical protein M9Y10_044283 [Tritrichomonas musculus]|uniref:Uncharacterized protein n=1 Tax=Tritrichomonas musculus TaxID=1915356 RepID=A0ABR2K234_9EUKA